jgi:hypothetical protein
MPVFNPPNGTIPLSRPKAEIGVLRYDGGSGYFPLPNIVCLGISARVGAEPWSARFRYQFDQRLDPTIYPRAMEHVLMFRDGLGATPYVVRNEDRIVVVQVLGPNVWQVLFDGFARVPQADYSPAGELVTFEAVGTPEREWDQPVAGPFYTDGDNVTGGATIYTNLPTRFNPDGLGNATPSGGNAILSGFSFPIFVDWRLVKANSAKGRLWTLPMAVQYLLGIFNNQQAYVRNAQFGALDQVLVNVRPAVDDQPINWATPSTYTVKDIIVPDVDVTGMAYPEAIARLLEPHGFLPFFELETNASGFPVWRLEIRRADDNRFWKVFGLQQQGAVFDPALTAVGGMTLQRDTSAIANEIVVDTSTGKYEASFILAPLGWTVAVADANTDVGTTDKWERGKATFDPIKYRIFGVDECGEGHWRFASGATSTIPCDFKPILGPTETEAERSWVRRRRPGSNEMITVNASGKPREAQLWIGLAATYTGPVPGVWNGEGNIVWQQVTTGNWRLLPDRLGIEITAPDVRNWIISEGAPPANAAVKSQKLNLVKSLANPDTVNDRFILLRLTTVVEGDANIPTAKASRQAGSPSRFRIIRRVDARDRYEVRTITGRSHFSPGTTTKKRDDTEPARNYAEALRRDGEQCQFAGSVTIPRCTTAVRLGDKLIGVTGRELYLQTNVGQENGEGPRYPVVVGVEWAFDGGQSTRILMADRRAEVLG